MREFPTNAVMERRMLTAAKESDSCRSPPTKEGEHVSSSNVFACVPLLVNLISTLFCYWFTFSYSLSVIVARNILSEQHSRSDDH